MASSEDSRRPKLLDLKQSGKILEESGYPAADFSCQLDKSVDCAHGSTMAIMAIMVMTMMVTCDYEIGEEVMVYLFVYGASERSNRSRSQPAQINSSSDRGFNSHDYHILQVQGYVRPTQPLLESCPPHPSPLRRLFILHGSSARTTP